MRQIGSLKEEAVAKRFADYLVSLDVAGHAEQESGEWAIWVRDENQLDVARQAFEEFQSAPDDAKYRDAQRKADEKRRKEQKRRESAAKNRIELRSQWNRPAAQQFPVTMSVIGICVLLFLAMNFGGDFFPRTLGLFDIVTAGQTGDRLGQIKAGQIWRIWTANLLHRDIIHLAFNMFMFYTFGIQVEARRGRFFLFFLILLLGFGSMGAELFTRGFPIGLSGVVYGLFGYIWIKSRLDPVSGFMMSDQTVLILVAFFFLSFTGMLGNIANGAHTGGLLTGIAFAYFSIPARRKR